MVYLLKWAFGGLTGQQRGKRIINNGNHMTTTGAPFVSPVRYAFNMLTRSWHFLTVACLSAATALSPKLPFKDKQACDAVRMSWAAGSLDQSSGVSFPLPRLLRDCMHVWG
jgi:hypothetical protein